MARKEKQLDKALADSFPASDPVAAAEPALRDVSRPSAAKADMAHIDVADEQEVRFWAREFGVDAAHIKAAVDAVGNEVDVVRRHLASSRATGSGSVP